MMHRKDYGAIANIVRNATILKSSGEEMDVINKDSLVRALETYFMNDNKSFRPAMFRAVCYRQYEQEDA